MRVTWMAMAAVILTACASSDPELAEPVAEPAPEPQPAAAAAPEAPPPPPEPELPAFAPRWKQKLSEWGGAVAIAPWGDVVHVSREVLTLHDRETGERIAGAALDGLKCLETGAGFQEDGSIVIVSEEAIDRVALPARTWERLVRLEGADRALVGQGWVLVAKGRTLTLYGLPGGERRREVVLEDDPYVLAVSPTAQWLAWSARRQLGFELLELGGEGRWRVGSKEVAGLGFGRARILVGIDPWDLVARDLATREELPGRYAVHGATMVAELPDGRPVSWGTFGAKLHLPAPRVPSSSWESATPGVELPLGSPEQVAIRADGAAIVGIDGNELICVALPGQDPPRPFELAALRGVSPPPPGRVAPAVAGDARALARAAARTAHQERLAADAPPPSLPSGGESFLAADERPAAADAWFVRLASAGLGGEFDTWGNEEVVVSVTVGGQSRTLAESTLDLEDGELLTWAAGDGPWLELKPVAGRFDLYVYDQDLTGRELMTALTKPVALAAGGFGLEPREERLGLRRLKGIEEAPWVELEWLRAPRRDARDAESARGVREAFGQVLELAAPETPQAARALGEQLGPAAEAAMTTAGRSTHTHLRRALPALATRAGELAHLAGQVGAADPALLDALRARFKAWFEECTVSDPELWASGQAAIAVELRAPLRLDQLDGLIDALLQVQADAELDTQRSLGPFPEPLTELLKAAVQARPGVAPDAARRLREGWSALREALRGEL